MTRKSNAMLALIAFGAIAAATWAEGSRPPRLPRFDARPAVATLPYAADRGGETLRLAAFASR